MWLLLSVAKTTRSLSSASLPALTNNKQHQHSSAQHVRSDICAVGCNDFEFLVGKAEFRLFNCLKYCILSHVRRTLFFSLASKHIKSVYLAKTGDLQK